MKSVRIRIPITKRGCRYMLHLCINRLQYETQSKNLPDR